MTYSSAKKDRAGRRVMSFDNSRNKHNPCTSCVHFHPAVKDFGYVGWSFLGFGPGRKPSSTAIQFAQCSAEGGLYASLQRRSCKGALWDLNVSEPQS